MRKSSPRVIVLVSALLAVLVAACGPVVPLEIAIRQAVVDVFYGGPKPAPSPAPLPVFQPPPPLNFTFPAVPALPPPAAFTCPNLKEFQVAKNPATSFISGASPKGIYAMRTKGTDSLASTKGTLPAQLSLIRPDQAAPGSDQVDGTYSDYSMVTGFSASTYTEFDFRLAPNNTATPGILLTGMKWRDPLRGNLDFMPQQPMQFLQTPVAPSSSWESAGWDPIDQTSVEFQAQINPQKDTVNACGTPLDAYQLQISGNIVSPTFQLSWSGSYDIGTQFGGLILAEQVTLKGPDRVQNAGDMYEYDETSIIDTEPPLVGS